MSSPPSRTNPSWGFRIGRLLQLIGLVIGLEGLLVFGAEPKEGPMVYTTLAAVAVFYLGWWIVRRYSPVSRAKKVMDGRTH